MRHTIDLHNLHIFALEKEWTMPALVRRSTAVLAALALIGLASKPFAIAQGPMEVQALVGEPFGVGSITLSLPAEMLPEPLGLEGVGVEREVGPRPLSGHAHAGPGKCPQGVSPRRTAR